MSSKKCDISEHLVTFLISVTDFINVASGGGGVIATINLQSFMPAKELGTIDMSLSDDGSRLCIVYGDGSVSVVDRNMYLRENPRRRSWAFQYTADDGRETPSSIAASLEKSGVDFSFSPHLSRSSSVVSNVDSSDAPAETESLSLAGLEKKVLPRSASASAKYLPDVVPVWRHENTGSGSCPVLTPKSAFFRVESGSSIADEDEPFLESADHSRVASPAIGGETSDFSLPLTISSAPRLLPLGPSLSLGQSRTCPSFSPPSAVTDLGQEKAACYHFQLPYWKDKAQCRKLVWTTKRLFIWLSAHNAFGVEEHIFILFSLSSEKVFSYRLVFDCRPIQFSLIADIMTLYI